jgi:hypothetical protein
MKTEIPQLSKDVSALWYLCKCKQRPYRVGWSMGGRRIELRSQPMQPTSKLRRLPVCVCVEDTTPNKEKKPQSQIFYSGPAEEKKTGSSSKVVNRIDF